MQDDKGYFWILTVLDHFTKHLWAEAFKTKEAPEIALWLLKTFRDGVVMPERWHADNGGEFINHHIDAVRELLAVNSVNIVGMMLPYSHSMPRNPQCQGLVERGNRTIKTTISKQMTRDGFKPGVHQKWEWRPYLEREVGKLNRKVPASQPFVCCLFTTQNLTSIHNPQIVKIYRFCPIVMLTGQPPEAPDHLSLSPEMLRNLHIYAADAMYRQAQGMANVAFCDTFSRGEVVLVHQVAKRSHKDARGKGARSYTARAVVVSTSKSNQSHYKIRWTTDGLVGREKTGHTSATMWPAWKLKVCQATKMTGSFYQPGEDDDAQADETRIQQEVMALGDETPEADDNDEHAGPPVSDREEIAARADRYDL